MGRGESSTSLAPGFRFHPTDEELLRYYLKRKVTNKPFRFEPISVVDVYKSEPWDLPAKSKLKTRDLEWYFFTVLDRKYSNGSKTNRATDRGYWKTTGKDRAIHCNSRVVGMKKTLVYHIGRAPKGQRTNWVMHEYRLEDKDLVTAGVSQDAFVLCRIFQKSGTGPKNGEQYGAPFVEEEWDDDELDVAPLPGELMVAAEEVAIADYAYADANDLEQNFGAGIVSENSPLPLNFYHGESSNHAEHPRSFSEDDNKPIIDSGENQFGSDRTDEQNFVPLPGQYEMDVTSGHNGYLAEPSNNVNDFGINSYVIDEPYLDATDNPPVEEGLYLEAKDLFNAVESDSAGDSNGFDVDEYLSFFDAEDANLTFDPSEIMGSEDVSAQLPQYQMDVNGGTEDVDSECQKLCETHGNTEASSSMQKPEAEKLQSDMKYPFLKQASHILGGIHAPPAFASEFPTKDAAIRLNSAQSSSSIHVTAAMIRIDNMTFGGTGVDLSFGKNQNVNIILSLDLSQAGTNPPSLVPTANIFSGKAGSAFSCNWFLLFFWVLILSVSYRIGTCICAK